MSATQEKMIRITEDGNIIINFIVEIASADLTVLWFVMNSVGLAMTEKNNPPIEIGGNN